MTANDLCFVMGSIAATGSSVSAARKGAHTRSALSPLLEGSSSSSSNQRCRSSLYKSFQDATDLSFTHLLPALFETPPPSAGNVRSATTPLSHVDPRFQKKSSTEYFSRIPVQSCVSACEDFNARTLSKKIPRARRRMLQSACSADQ